MCLLRGDFSSFVFRLSSFPLRGGTGEWPARPGVPFFSAKKEPKRALAPQKAAGRGLYVFVLCFSMVAI